MLQKFLYKLKQDLSALSSYPVNKLSGSFSVDYDQYWSQRRAGAESVLSRWQQQRADLILGMIESGVRVLDFGCGDGAVLKYLKDRSHIQGRGYDLSSQAVARAKEIGVEAIQVDFTDLAGLEDLPQVDYIIGLEILEHMPNPEEFISTVKAKAEKGMIFSFPNSGYYQHRLRLLLGRFPCQWISHPGEHLRFWTVRDVKWWTRAMGLKLDNLIVYEGLPVLNKIWPSLFGRGIIIKIQ